MQLKKIMISFGVIVCMCANSGMATYADTTTAYVDDGISLAYEIATNARSNLNISGKKAYCTSSAVGKNTRSIAVVQTLQKHRSGKAWDELATWDGQVDRTSIYLSNSKDNLNSGTYRVESVFTLINNDGKSETITVYSNEETIE